MYRTNGPRRSLATAAALVLTAWGVTSLPASADPGNGDGKRNSHSQSAKKKNHKPASPGKGHQGKSAGAANKGGAKGGAKGGGKGGDPAGNNGTVKIAPLGEMDGIPNNTPHPGCEFQIEWYGFDQGADIISEVTFTMQAPTSDVVVSGTEPSEVYVGEDPASGAGTDSGHDATQAYSLSFAGEPHRKQGYHVKLTIHTPGSQGADTKHKVFWVEPCEGDTEQGGTEEGGTEEGGTEEGGTEEGGTEEGGTEEDDDAEVAGLQSQQGDGSDTEVAGVEASTGAGGDQGVPNAVDAGAQGNPVLSFITSPLLPLLVIGLGALLAGITYASRRRGASSSG